MHVFTQLWQPEPQGVLGGKHEKIQDAEHAAEHAAICPVPPHELDDDDPESIRVAPLGTALLEPGPGL
jgi:hypothetical protein